MKISINTSTPDSSYYVLLVDVPYRFSARHFSAACQQDTSRSLINRVCHVVIGSLLLLPIINLVIAAVEYYFTTLSISLSHPIQAASPSSSLPATPEKQNAASDTTPKSKIQTALYQLEKEWRENPYVIANHEEVHPPETRYNNFDMFAPFQKSLENGDLETARRFIQDPHFKGLNTTYSFEIKIGNFSSFKPCSSLVIAAYKKNMPIFEMLLQHPATNLESCKLLDENSSPLLLICQLGEGYEAFIDKLIEQGACPSFRGHSNRSEITALSLAEKSKVSSETLGKLSEWIKLNECDRGGNNLLQQAVKHGDLSAFNKALANGICLNNRNWDGQTALHLAVLNLSKPQAAAVAKEMIDLLLAKRTQLNIQDVDGYTPLLHLICDKPSNWEQLAISFLERGADPEICSDRGVFASQLLLTYTSTHPVKAYLLQRSDGLHAHYQNQFDLATVLGAVMTIGVGKQSICTSGSNYSEAIYELLGKVIDHFVQDPETSEDIRQLFLSAKDATLLAKEISFMADPDEIVKKIKAANHPVLISSGWTGHAVSLTIYNDELILGGLRRYKLMHDLFQERDFKKLIACNMNNREIPNGTQYYRQLSTLGCVYQSTLELPDQKVGNCTWASSALLGLRSVLEIQDKGNSEKIADGIEQFNHYAQSFVILRAVEHLKANISKLPLSLYPRCLSSSADWLCSQIHEKKDRFGYYKKALDAITFSGFRLDRTNFRDQVVRNFYTHLYKMDTPSMETTLMQSAYQIHNWVAFQ